ncbi:MAG: hypothetical protein ACTSQH_02485 [Candidatus Hodarchaeales archaeon]
MSDLYQNRHYRLGWGLLLLQNVLIFIFPLLSTPVLSSEVFRFLALLGIIGGVNVIFDYIFTFTMILDIFAIFLISISTFKYFLSLKEKQGERDFRSRSFYVPLTGLLWVTCSFLWRLPFYLMGGFELGLASGRSFVAIEPNPTYDNLLKNPALHLFLIIGSISLFFFLYFQDKDYLETFDLVDMTSDVGNFGYGRSTLLGAFNLLGVIFMFFGSTLTPRSVESMELFSSNPNGFSFLIGLILKFLVVPPLAIWTSLKFLSSNKLKFKAKNSEPSPFMKSIS